MTLQSHGLLWLDDSFWPEASPLYQTLADSVTWVDSIRARRVASFGRPYNYSGTVWPELPLLDVLIPVLDRLAARLGYAPNNCLANYYPDGRSTMGYHFDATEGLVAGTGIAILSLGATRTLTFRHNTTRAVEAYPLGAGSLLFMTTELQREWKHAVLADGETSAGRISLTFRCLAISEGAEDAIV